jgi:hypothetical protein
MFISQIRRFDMILGMSKSSISGVLGLINVLCLTLSGLQIPAALATPGIAHVWLWITFVILAVSAICQCVVKFLQNDAHSIPVIARTIVANGGLVATAESTTSNLVTK